MNNLFLGAESLEYGESNHIRTLTENNRLFRGVSMIFFEGSTTLGAQMSFRVYRA